MALPQGFVPLEPSEDEDKPKASLPAGFRPLKDAPTEPDRSTNLDFLTPIIGGNDLHMPLVDAVGLLEMLVAVGTGMAREWYAGIEGLSATVNPFEEEGAGADVVRDIQENVPTYSPRTESGQRQLGAVGGFVEDIAQSAREPTADLARTMDILSGTDPASAQQNRSNIMEMGVSPGLQVSAFERGAGPLAATGAALLPDVAMDIATAGAGPLIGAGARGASAAAKGAGALGKEVGGELLTASKELASPLTEMVNKRFLRKMPEMDGLSPQEAHEQVARAVRKNDVKALVTIVQPNQRFYDLLEYLDIDIEPLAAFASNNPFYIDVSNALSKIPGTQMSKDLKDFMEAMSAKADQLIEQYGGTRDKDALSDQFRDESAEAIKLLAEQEEALSKIMMGKIRPGRSVATPATARFLKEQIRIFKGVHNLPKAYRDAMKQLGYTPEHFKAAFIEVDELPSYANFDLLRQNVGRSIDGDGPYTKDTTNGLLKKLYGVMKNDQEKIAQQYGGLDELQARDALTDQRKTLEATQIKLLTRTLQGSMMAKMAAAVRGLGKNDLKNWDELMSRMPDKTLRERAVLSGLGELLRDPIKFNTFMQHMKNNPTAAKRLMRELPPASAHAINAMAELSEIVVRTMEHKINPAEMNKLLYKQQRMLAQLMGFAVEAVATPFLPGRIGMPTREFVRLSSDAALFADRVMSSPKFKIMLRSAAKDDFLTGAPASKELTLKARVFEKSAEFRDWMQALNPDARAQLATMGVLNYLFRPDGEANEPVR